MHNRTTRLFLAVFVAALMSFTLTALSVARAEGEGTEAEAIAIAAQHPAFAGPLADHPGWKGAAYYTDNVYKIWRVQFYDKDGDELAWADVNVARRRVYAFETGFEPTEEQQRKAKEIILAFLNRDSQIRELIGKPIIADQLWMEYNTDGRYWGVSVYVPGNSLWLVIEFPSEIAFDFRNPTLRRIYFGDVLSYPEWLKSMQAQAIAIAYKNPEVAAAVRDHDGWNATAEVQTGSMWLVTFRAGDKVLVNAVVDLAGGNLITFSIVGN